MRILFICHEYPPSKHGGIGIFVKSIAEALLTQGCQTAVIGYDEKVMEDELQVVNKVDVFRLVNPYKNKHGIRIGGFTLNLYPILERRYFSKKLEQIIHTWQPDLIEGIDWSGPLWHKPSRPLLIRLHGSYAANQLYESKPVRRLIYYLEKRNLFLTTFYCGVSKHIAKWTRTAFHFKQDFSIIYNSVNTKKFAPLAGIPKKDYSRVFLGRIDARKGIEELINAMAICVASNPAIHLTIIGNGDPIYLEKLKNRIDPTCREHISFSGFIPNDELPRYINPFMLGVMPSRAEAFGITAIELMSCGIPIIMTNKAAGPEIVTDGEDGWLVDPSNVEALAAKIIEAFADMERVQLFGKNARRKVERIFAEGQMMQQNIQVYKSILGHAN